MRFGSGTSYGMGDGQRTVRSGWRTAPACTCACTCTRTCPCARHKVVWGYSAILTWPGWKESRNGASPQPSSQSLHWSIVRTWGRAFLFPFLSCRHVWSSIDYNTYGTFSSCFFSFCHVMGTCNWVNFPPLAFVVWFRIWASTLRI